MILLTSFLLILNYINVLTNGIEVRQSCSDFCMCSLHLTEIHPGNCVPSTHIPKLKELRNV